MKNNYAKKLAEARQLYLDAGVDVGIQMMADFMSIALNDPEVMGNSALGASRLKKVLAKSRELHAAFSEAFRSGPEADYYREKLDQRLRQIYAADAAPFEERYPLVKEIRYK